MILHEDSFTKGDVTVTKPIHFELVLLPNIVNEF